VADGGRGEQPGDGGPGGGLQHRAGRAVPRLLDGAQQVAHGQRVDQHHGGSSVTDFVGTGTAKPTGTATYSRKVPGTGKRDPGAGLRPGTTRAELLDESCAFQVRDCG
jgi:hypothetical protein